MMAGSRRIFSGAGLLLAGLLVLSCTSDSKSAGLGPGGSLPAITATPDPVTFTATSGGSDPSPASVAVTNGGSGASTDLVGLSIRTVTYGAGQPVGWLNLGLSGDQTPTTLDLRPTASTLPPGNYSANVVLESTVSGVSPKTVTISLSVTSGPIVALTPATTVLDVVAGNGTQDQATIAVTNAGVGALSGLVVDSIQYTAGEPAGWLTATFMGGTAAPASLNVRASGAGLAAGTYTATVHVGSSLSGVASADLTVGIQVAPGPAIIAQPTGLSFGAVAAGAAPAAQVVAVTNGGGGTLAGMTVGTIVYGAGATGWLTAALGSPAAPTTLTLQPNTTNLPVGTYTADVPVVSSLAGVAPTTVRVTYTVATSPIIGLSPATIGFTATAGGASPAAKPVSVTNTGNGTLSGLAVGTVAYGAGQPTGWLGAVLNQATAPATLTLTATTGALLPGTYTATVPVTSSVAGVTTTSVAVTFTVVQGPVIAATPTNVAMSAVAGGTHPGPASILITNTGGGSLTGLGLAITYGAGQPVGWLQASLAQTTAPTTLVLQAATGTLPQGTYSATVRLISGVAQQPRDVAVTLSIGAGPTIFTSAPSLNFAAVTGGPNPPAQGLTVLNSGGGTLSGLSIGSIFYTTGQPVGWLAAGLAGNTAPTTLTVTPSTGSLPTGTYTAFVQLTSSLSGVAPDTVPVVFSVGAAAAQPAFITLVSGDNQSGFISGFLTAPIVARVFDQAGQPLPNVRVTWSADPDGGIFSADSLSGATGQVQATWRLSSFTGRQNAQVSVPGLTPLVFTASASLPDSNFPNEPPGLTQVTDRAFDSKAATTSDRIGSEGWDPIEAARPNFSIIFDGTALLSPTKVGQMFYPAGMAGGVAPATAQIAWSKNLGYTVMYQRFAMRLSSNFQAHRSSTNKIFHLWKGPLGGASSNNVFYSAEGAGTGHLFLNIRLQGSNVPDARPRLPPNAGANAELVRGKWQMVEVYVQINTPGKADGIIKAWVDGVLTHNYSDVALNANGGEAFDQLQFSPTWGGTGDVVIANQYLWVDHSYLAGKK